MIQRLKTQHIPLLATAALLSVLYVGAALRYKGFFSWFQFTSLFNDNASLGLVAVGMSFVILSGGIDLSVGAAVALASMVLAVLLETWHWPIFVAIPAVLGLGALCGGSMGLLIQRFRLPSFLVTLAGMFLAQGVALAMTSTKRIDLAGNASVIALEKLRVAGLNLPALVMLGAMGAAVVIASYTRFGRAVYALGGSESSALLMGLPLTRTRVTIFAVSGLCAALGGTMHAIGLKAGDSSIGSLMELDAIAAVVIGGTLLTGGVGHPAGTLLGMLILAIITVVPTYQGNLNPSWTKIAIGGLLLAFIVLQRLLQVPQNQDA